MFLSFDKKRLLSCLRKRMARKKRRISIVNRFADGVSALAGNARRIEKAKDGVVKLNMNREQLAAYLGTTRPSLSRELSKMKEDGLIDIKKDAIIILDREELEDFM